MKTLPIVLVLAVLVMVGCDQKLRMTVNNTTHETRDVSVSVGGQRPQRLGTVRAGGSMKHTFKIPKDSLPTELQWRCGGLQGQETVVKGQKKLVINVERDTAVVTDGNAEIDRRVESQTIIDVRSNTVVE